MNNTALKKLKKKEETAKRIVLAFVSVSLAGVLDEPPNVDPHVWRCVSGRLIAALYSI